MFECGKKYMLYFSKISLIFIMNLVKYIIDFRIMYCCLILFNKLVLGFI